MGHVPGKRRGHAILPTDAYPLSSKRVQHEEAHPQKSQIKKSPSSKKKGYPYCG
jgi:hypothetical protein